MLHNLLSGLSGVLTPGTLPYLVIGMCVGMFVAMLPGLGVGIALSLMLPFLYHMNSTAAILLMLGTLAGEYFSASITAILLNTPGAPESFPTTHDGFPMAQRGEAGRALAISATCTWLGGWIACVIFVGLLQLTGPLISLFKPPEYAAIIVLALVVVGQSGRTQASKVIVSGGFGFMLSFVGSDPVSGQDRFTGNVPALLSGLDVVPFALGVFAVTQIVIMYGSGKSVSGKDDRIRITSFGSQIRIGIRDTFSHPVAVFRSAAIAAALGLIPGIGGFTANYISYGVGQRVSKARKDFGTGTPEGIISAEGSSLAKEVGSLLPAVTLGLPSGVGMVLFIAALSILGLQPGTPLLTEHASLPYSMMWAMAIAGLLSCCVGLLLAPHLSKITYIKGPLLLPLIGGLATLGSFSAVVSTAGMLEMIFFVVVGVIARKCNYSVASMAVGLVLGSTFDDNVFLTQQSDGWSFLWHSPIATVALAIAAFIVVKRVVDTRRHRAAPSTPAVSDPRTGRAAEGPWALQLTVDAVFVAGSVWYLLVALSYPTTAGIIPAVTAAVVGAVSAGRLLGDSWRQLRDRGSRPASTPRWRRTRGAPVTLGMATASPGPARATPLPADQPAALQASGRPLSAELMTEPSRGAEAAAGAEAASSAPAHTRFGLNRRELFAVAWAASFVIGTLLFGFQLGIPLAALLYCVFGLRLKPLWFHLAYTVGAVAVLYGLATIFLSAFHLTFSGVII